MQFPGTAKPAVGIVFDTAMGGIDDVLALAMLYGFEGKSQARIAAIAVSSGDLRAAQFCDALRLFNAGASTGPGPANLHGMPMGLADGGTAAESSIFNKLGKPVRATGIDSVKDTADPATLMRNALMAQHDQNAAMVLSGAATDLARLLDMYGAKDWIVRKVRLLCVTGTGKATDSASEKVLAGWPTPMVTVGPEIGEALPFPGESMEKDFAWSTGHPVVDAYRRDRPMPYDAPSCAMAAMLYTVRPDEGYFKLSDGGKRRHLIFDAGQKERVIRAYIEMASAKPVPRKPRRPPDEKKKEEDKEEKKDEKNDAEP
jgi:hypothetical protein